MTTPSTPPSGYRSDSTAEASQTSTRVLRLRWALAALAGCAVLGGLVFFAYRIALARVPQYRASLERLVRARTGLDVRFNELALSWGWYGPEAVFRAVELGEPGRSRVLLRASELIIDFDVWHALHTGQLEAGRMTLVAPDIDITGLQAHGRGAAPGRGSDADLVARWPSGRVDVEDATVSVPDPARPSQRLQFAVRRATLSRSAAAWSADAEAVLPQRLGRSALVALRLAQARPGGSWSGTARFEGHRLQLGGWRSVLGAAWPGAPDLPSAGIGNVSLQLRFADGRLSDVVADMHADDVALGPATASAGPDELPLGRVQAVFHLDRVSGRWRLVTSAADIGPFRVATLGAVWTAGAADSLRLEGTAQGRIEDVMAWLDHSRAAELASVASRLRAEGRVMLRFESVDPLSAGTLRVSAALAADSVSVAPQLPPFEHVSGTLTFVAGRLLRSTLDARWLGGPATVHVAERDRAPRVLLVQAEGTLDAGELVAATGVDTGGARVAGRSPWRGELVLDAAQDVWHARTEASFVGVASALPDPLAKPEGQAAPFRVELAGSNGRAIARVTGQNVRGAFELAVREDGLWVPRRGVLRFGGGAAELGPRPALELQGRLDSVDLPAWLSAWRQLASSAQALPVRAALQVGELTLAGQRYSDVTLIARTSDGFDLSLDSPDIAGTVHWPKELTSGAPVDAHLERIDVQDSAGPIALAPLLAALGPAADVQADRVTWHGHALGTLAAHVETRASGLVVDPLRLSGDTQKVEAAVRCSSSRACRARFQLASHDAAATLRDFGFRADVASEHAQLEGDLQWPRELPALEQAWLASATGHVRLELTGGTVRAAPEEPGVPFALLGISALLSDPPATLAVATQGAAAPALEFSRLSADYVLRDGEASTSDLRFEGDAEILLDGRVGLTTRDYDCRARILRGEERLPEALRSFLSTPRVAAAWMALRELISGPGGSGAELHLGGTWEAPDVHVVTEPDTDK